MYSWTHEVELTSMLTQQQPPSRPSTLVVHTATRPTNSGPSSTFDTIITTARPEGPSEASPDHCLPSRPNQGQLLPYPRQQSAPSPPKIEDPEVCGSGTIGGCLKLLRPQRPGPVPCRYEESTIRSLNSPSIPAASKESTIVVCPPSRSNKSTLSPLQPSPALQSRWSGRITKQPGRFINEYQAAHLTWAEGDVATEAPSRGSPRSKGSVDPGGLTVFLV